MALTALLAQGTSALAQTGAVSLLCIENQNPNNRVAFDIDYDQKTIIGDLARGRGRYLTMSMWNTDHIVWGYGSQPTHISGVMYQLNRRTRVLNQIFFPENEGQWLICNRSEERPL